MDNFDKRMKELKCTPLQVKRLKILYEGGEPIPKYDVRGQLVDYVRAPPKIEGGKRSRKARRTTRKRRTTRRR